MRHSSDFGRGLQECTIGGILGAFTESQTRVSPSLSFVLPIRRVSDTEDTLLHLSAGPRDVSRENCAGHEHGAIATRDEQISNTYVHTTNNIPFLSNLRRYRQDSDMRYIYSHWRQLHVAIRADEIAFSFAYFVEYVE